MTKTLEEIGAFNHAWLLLARRLLRVDKAAAMLLLGLSEPVSETLANLSDEQIVDLSRSNHLLCRFRLDDRTILAALENKSATTRIALEEIDDTRRGEP